MVNGVAVEPVIESDRRNNKNNGNTLGITLGIGWNGMTPIQGLTYSVAVSGYRYQFDADDKSLKDIHETSVNLKLGLAYLF